MPRNVGPARTRAPVASKPIELNMQGYEVVEKVVMSAGTSGRVYVPISWVGKTVRIVRLEE